MAMLMVVTMSSFMLSIFIIFFSLIPGLVLSHQSYSTSTKLQLLPGNVTVVLPGQSYSTFTKLQLPSIPGNVSGPESAGFDVYSIGPYITVYDGRILIWRGPTFGFVDFAYTSPNRTRECDGTTDPELGPKCGRPVDLSFDYATQTFFIVDLYYGLLEVGICGGLAKQIATTAERWPFKFLTGLDVDFRTGIVYFSDASEIFGIRDSMLPQIKNDSTGRFMKYNLLTKQVTVLLRDLNGGGGPAVSSDSSYVLVPESRAGNIYKYWLTGPKANSSELLLSVAGNVNKIKSWVEKEGEYWVATDLIQTQGSTTLTIPQGLRINGNGTILQTVSFAAQFFNKTISVVQQNNKALYVGSPLTDFIGKYTDTTTCVCATT